MLGYPQNHYFMHSSDTKRTKTIVASHIFYHDRCGTGEKVSRPRTQTEPNSSNEGN